MMKLTLILFILLSSSVWAREAVNFDIDKFNYIRPQSNIGPAGNFQFNKFSLFYFDFMSEITNEDGRFDAKIFIRNNFIGLIGKQIKFGVNTKDGDILNSIKKAEGQGLKVVLNSKKVSLKSNSLHLISPKLNIVVPRPASLFCQKADGFQSNDPADLERACLNYLKYSPIQSDRVETRYESTTKGANNDEKYIRLDGNIEKIEFVKNDILFNSGKLALNLNRKFLVTGNNFDFNCAKKDIAVMDSDQLLQHCLHDFAIGPASTINVLNLKDNSEFAFFPRKVTLHDEKFEFKTPSLDINMNGEITKLEQMNFNCFVNENSDATDVSAYIQGCLKDSFFEIGSVLTSSSSNKNIDIFEGRLKGRKAKKGRLQDILMIIKNGKISLTSEVKFLFKFDLSLEATGSFNEQTKVLHVHVDRAKLPFGVRSVKLLMYFIKKMMASKTVEVSGKHISIQL